MSRAKLTQEQLINQFNESKKKFFSKHQNTAGLVLDNTRLQKKLKKVEERGRKYRRMMEMDVEFLNEILHKNKHVFSDVDYAAQLRYLMDRAAILTAYYTKHHIDNHQNREKYRKMCVEIEELQHLMWLKHTDEAIQKMFAEQKLSTIRTVTGQKKAAGMAHGNRITWTFFRLTLIATVSLTLSEAQKIADVVNVPNELCRALSVGLLAFRLFANLGSMAADLHNLYQMRDKGDPIAQILIDNVKDQLEGRICQILNDLVWMIINLITNYNKLFTMPGFNMVQDVLVFGHALPIAGVVTSAFLVFDVGILLLQWFALDKPKFDMKRTQLEAERDIVGLSDSRKKMIDLELKELDVLTITTRARMSFSVVAASLLVIGFTASMFFSAGMSLPISYAIVLLGCGFYDCAESFGKWRGASERVRQQEVFVKSQNMSLFNDKDLGAAKALRTQALKDFGMSLVKNVAFPGLIIGVCAASWQVALGIVVAYAAYWMFTKGREMWKQYQADKKKKLIEAKGEAKPSEADIAPQNPASPVAASSVPIRQGSRGSLFEDKAIHPEQPDSKTHSRGSDPNLVKRGDAFDLNGFEGDGASKLVTVK